MTVLLRRIIPLALLPLSLIACALASSLWLRAYPSSVLSVPLFGAALLSVLLPFVIIGIGIRKLWLTALIDLVGFVFFTMLVALREPVGFGDLVSGVVHGPAQILTFALPLVSPRSLLVAPVALCWVGGAVIGECIARGWQSVVPYATLLVVFGLTYAGTARAISSSSTGHRYDTLAAAALLLTLLLLRASQSWVEQDQSAEVTQPEGVLPLRGLLIGAALSVVISVLAASVVQTSPFSGNPVAPARQPPVDQTTPLTPLSFIANQRPTDPRAKGDELFKVTLDSTSSRYIGLGDVDTYDGDSWTFQNRTFRPSGGVIPADPNASTTGPAVAQQYVIDKGPMTTIPWMPFQYRPQNVSGTSVNIDTASGMIVPTHPLHAGSRYSVLSTTPDPTLDATRGAVAPGLAAQSYIGLDPTLQAPLTTVVASLRAETGTSAATSPLEFLKLLAADLRGKYGLAGATGARGSATGSATGSPTPSATSSAPTSRPRSSSTPRRAPASGRRTTRAKSGRFDGLQVRVAPTKVRTTAAPAKARTTAAARPSTARRTSTSPKAPASLSSSSADHAGGTSLSSVLTAILGPTRSGTPEQFATLFALVARAQGIPARLVTGFRLPTSGNSPSVGPGTLSVTTGDAWTWVEVAVSGKGWLVVDPTPGKLGTTKDQSKVSAAPSPSPTSTPTPNALVTDSNQGHAVAPKSRIPGEHHVSGIGIAVVVIIVIAAALVLVLLGLLLRKWLRVRRRRRAGDPRRRLVGAWQESLDVLEESGLPDLTNLTSAEVAALTGERFGRESGSQVRYLGDSANAAIFSPTSWIGPAEADAAWRAQVVLRKNVRSTLSLPARVNAGLRYHRAPHTRALVGPSSWTQAARARATAQNRMRRRGRHSTKRRAH